MSDIPEAWFESLRVAVLDAMDVERLPEPLYMRLAQAAELFPSVLLEPGGADAHAFRLEAVAALAAIQTWQRTGGL